MTTAIVSSVIANKPFNGGNAWAVLSWVAGLEKLGMAVWLVETIDPARCVDTTGRPTAVEQSVNLAYFRDVVARFGLRAALVIGDGERVEGTSWSELLDVASSAELLLNITGHLDVPAIKSRVRRKIYLDLDPGFTQAWHADGSGAARLDGHDAYFTVGENIGTPACSIPTGGIRWQATRQPVLLDEWPMIEDGAGGAFTTVTSWRGPYGAVVRDGRAFPLKHQQFRKFAGLPRRVRQPFEIAADIDPADTRDREMLATNGWRIVSARDAVADPAGFRGYVQASRAEFSVAQGVYVETGSGWFSDRTVKYLASGRPALVQDTGFGRSYPVGQGLLAFRTLEDAVAGAESIADDYAAHRKAARAIAEEYFAADKVVGALLADAGVSP